MKIKNQLDKLNSKFWNELCGSVQAKQMGISDWTNASLTKYDEWYFSYYALHNKHYSI